MAAFCYGLPRGDSLQSLQEFLVFYQDRTKNITKNIKMHLMFLICLSFFYEKYHLFILQYDVISNSNLAKI